MLTMLSLQRMMSSQLFWRLAQDMVDNLARGGFNLTKFTSNSKEVLKTIPSDKLSKQGLDLDMMMHPSVVRVPKRSSSLCFYHGKG